MVGSNFARILDAPRRAVDRARLGAPLCTADLASDGVTHATVARTLRMAGGGAREAVDPESAGALMRPMRAARGG